MFMNEKGLPLYVRIGVKHLLRTLHVAVIFFNYG